MSRPARFVVPELTDGRLTWSEAAAILAGDYHNERKAVADLRARIEALEDELQATIAEMKLAGRRCDRLDDGEVDAETLADWVSLVTGEPCEVVPDPH